MVSRSKDFDGIQAFVQEESSLLTVRIALVRFEEFGSLHVPGVFPRPTHILHLRDSEEYAREWREIDDPYAVQDPTLRLDETEARALLDALMQHFQTELPSPVILNFQGPLSEEALEEIRKRFLEAVKTGRPEWR